MRRNSELSMMRAMLVVIAGSLLLASTAGAGSIGLNFVENNDSGVQNGNADSLGAAESAGAPGYQQTNWNNLGRWGVGVGPLNDSSGAATGVTATWDSNNTWRVGLGLATPDEKLMHGYIDATGQVNVDGPPYQFFWNENKPEVYVTGLSAWLGSQGMPRYNVVVYSDGDVDEGRVGEYWLQAAGDANDPPQLLGGDLSSHVFVRDSANFSGVYTQVPLSHNTVDNPGDGNYVVFSGVTADSFILRTEEHTFRAQINGVQIIAVPEAGTLVYLATCGLMLVAASRRHR